MAVLLPIKPVTKPSTLTGQLNGQLAVALLTLIGVGSAVMELTAARAFRAMFAAARAAGFDIKEVGDYRTFKEQLDLFLSRYKPVEYGVYTATPAKHRKYWQYAPNYGYKSKYWIKKDFDLATAATPGESNHGWGLALDIAEETDGDPGPEGITQRFVDWLILNADRFGICAELQSEKWHWRYYAGDKIPVAVLAYEQGTPPPPSTPDPDPIPDPDEVTVQFQTDILKKGSVGPSVIRIQQIMNEVAGQGLTADGQFGTKTETSVKNWQLWFKVPTTQPGVVDQATWESFIEVWLATGKP